MSLFVKGCGFCNRSFIISVSRGVRCPEYFCLEFDLGFGMSLGVGVKSFGFLGGGKKTSFCLLLGG